LFYPTAIGTEPEEPDFDSRDSWQRVMIGHAVANQVGVIASNRAGVEGDRHRGAITFHGSSFICDQRGDKLAELDRVAQGVITATFDLDRLHPGPGLDGLLPRPPARAVRAAGEVAAPRRAMG
jgi:N-carbamoylputrescine amidase